MIVLNETEWARQAIRSANLGKKPVETLGRIARFYIDGGCSKEETIIMLRQFLLRCDPSVSLPRWSQTISRTVSRALKTPALNIDYIPITRKELEAVGLVQGRQCKRLAFTLLCLSKYWRNVNPKSDGWVNNKDSEIMRLANINTSALRQCLMYNTLNDMGLIQFSKRVDVTSVKVLFANDESEEVLQIKDFRNLGYQYLKYCGERYIECEGCGITTKCNDVGRARKYCDSCAAAAKIRQSINSVMRQRGSQ